MFLGFGKAERKRPTREHYQQEAALLLASRIAEGRPPPEVWRKAEEWRVKRARPAGWYLAGTRDPSSEWTPRQPATIGLPFVLRLVRLPLAGAATSPKGTQLGPRAVNTTD